MTAREGQLGLRLSGALLVLLLVLPFLLRPREPSVPPNAERLVVLTPHNEAVRYEFEHAFRRRLRARGREVIIDWRTPGGTAEIARYLQGEYRAAFEQHWTRDLGQPLDEGALSAFQSAKQKGEGEDVRARARRAFLASKVGIEVDLLFGGGSFDFEQHAGAGRLVDAGFVSGHPELFGAGEGQIPEIVGGERYYDPRGRWVGAAVSGFGICYGPRTIERLGIAQPPARWRDLGEPAYHGHVALADPSKSGAATKAFEMLIQESIAEAVQEEPGALAAGSEAERRAIARGFDQGLLLIRRIAGNARYFTDSSNKIPQDIQAGSAAAGMCIDFYGRFQSQDTPDRMRFVMPAQGSSLGSDPIGMLRGAPSEGLAREFIQFVLSLDGQGLWALQVGKQHGPERYALRRSAILPEIYGDRFLDSRSDRHPIDPYQDSQNFSYHAAWTAPLFRALAFSIRVLCVDAERELHAAWAALIEARFPPQAQAHFERLGTIDHERLLKEIAPILERGDPLAEVALTKRLLEGVLAEYAEVRQLAEEGK